MKTDVTNTTYRIVAGYEIDRYKGERTLISCDDPRLLKLCFQVITIDEFKISVLEKLNSEIKQCFPQYLLGGAPVMGLEDVLCFDLKIYDGDKIFTFDEYKEKVFESSMP